MDGLDFLVSVAAKIAIAIGLIAIPLVYAFIGMTVLAAAVNKDFYALPWIVRLALLSGALIGLGLIYASEGGADFAWNRIFADQGPWDVPFSAFLAERVNPANYDPVGLVRFLGAADDPLPLSLFMSIPALFLVAIALGSLWAWKPLAALQAIACSLGVALWSAYLAIYLVAALYWLLNTFNFWSLLVLGLLYQHYRNTR
ncbi:MAG: hypothetical protein ACT4P2_11010 [Pseudomonadota bacterium]